MNITRALAVGAVCLLPSWGCSLHALTGDTMISYTTEHMVPYAMGSADVDRACETGVSLGQFLRSFSRVTDEPHRAAVITELSAGMCSEGHTWEAELRHLRALKEGRVAEAQDARIEEQRFHIQAARRYLDAWQNAEAAFGAIGNGGCPEFEEAGDKALYLLGMMSGAQAVTHDRAAGGVAGVPLDLPPKVARGAECLDDDHWWGVPGALKAAVWTSVPGAAPEGADPWALLEAAVKKGEAKGVRLARAVHILAAEAAGRPEDVRQAIRDHAASLEKTPADPNWQLLDANATLVVTHVSDRLWTQGKGHRTPLGGLGTFWDAEGVEEGGDDLLDDIAE